MDDKQIYKIMFHNQDKIYEIYAHEVNQSDMFGFIEVAGMIFGEKTELLIDPAEEKLQAEFSGVECSYIPLNAIIRIDRVAKQGTNKIISTTDTSNVTTFPSPAFTPGNKNN